MSRDHTRSLVRTRLQILASNNEFSLGRAWASPTLVKRLPPRSMIYVCLVRHSVNKCPRVLIHWTASILHCIINSVNATHVQIIETASILHLQWAYSTTTSRCTLLLTTHDTTQLHHSLIIVHWVGQLKLSWAKLLTNRLLSGLLEEDAVKLQSQRMQRIHTAREGSPHNVLHSSSLKILFVMNILKININIITIGA